MNMVITTHLQADFDALASAVAAQKLYPGSVIVLPGLLNTNVRSFLNLYRDFFPFMEPEHLPERCDRLIIVDTRQRQRLHSMIPLLDREDLEIHIYDHHPPGEDDLTGDRVVTELVGAATTLLVEEIKNNEMTLSGLEATVLAMGIYEDTGYLTYSSTTARDVEAMAFLWRQGVNTEIVQEFLQRPLSPMQKNLFESLFDQTKFYEINQRRVLISQASSQEYIQGISELIHRLSFIEEAEAAFVLVEMDNKTYLVARSFQDDINLLNLLSFWVVKGHPAAVSATFKNSSVQQVLIELIQLLKMNIPYPLLAVDIASSPAKTITQTTTVREASELLSGFGHSGFVVVDEQGKMTGVVSHKDLYKALRHNLGHAPVKAFMSRNVVSAGPEEPVNAVRQLMIDNNIGRVPIINEHGELTGVVTRTDILRSFYRMEVSRNSPYDLKKKQGVSIPKRGKNLLEIEDITGIINNELPHTIQRILLLIGQRAEREGCKVFLVGGCIRDMLLGQSLPEDLDIAVMPEAIPFARQFNEFVNGKLQVFEPFGTASIFTKEGFRLDFVTARREFYLSPAALPQVEASSLKNDLFRRDFTINTLACSLNPVSFGRLYDFFGGRKDLSEGIIRVLYQLSFVDDPLRMLRAARFARRFDFTIEEETMEILKSALEKQMLMRVSRSRLNGEIKLIFREPDPPAVLKYLEEMKILPLLFPRVLPTDDTWLLLERIRGELEWAAARVSDQKFDREVMYVGGLYAGRHVDTVMHAAHRLNYSRPKCEKLTAIAQDMPAVMEKLMAEDRINPSMVYNQLNPLPPEALLLMRVMATKSRIKNYPVMFWDNLQRVKPHHSGESLKEMGIVPGPLYGRILKDLREAIMDGRVKSPKEEKDFILSSLKNINKIT